MKLTSLSPAVQELGAPAAERPGHRPHTDRDAVHDLPVAELGDAAQHAVTLEVEGGQQVHGPQLGAGHLGHATEVVGREEPAADVAGAIERQRGALPAARGRGPDGIGEAEEVALAESNADLAEQFELIVPLDALGDHVDVLGFGEGDVGPHHRARHRVVDDVTDEGTVDLDERGPDAGNERETRRRRVVDREVDARRGELVELRREVADPLELRSPDVDGQAGSELLALVEEAGIGQQVGSDVDEQDRAVGRGTGGPDGVEGGELELGPQPGIIGAGEPRVEAALARAHPCEGLPADGAVGVQVDDGLEDGAQNSLVDHISDRWRLFAAPARRLLLRHRPSPCPRDLATHALGRPGRSHTLGRDINELRYGARGGPECPFSPSRPRNRRSRTARASRPALDRRTAGCDHRRGRAPGRVAARRTGGGSG